MYVSLVIHKVIANCGISNFMWSFEYLFPDIQLTTKQLFDIFAELQISLSKDRP